MANTCVSVSLSVCFLGLVREGQKAVIKTRECNEPCVSEYVSV